ncbi:MAG: helix-turn-helix domain-containing protein [Alphaproteobacteria bacterium]|nr:helix-turn-helix domain-containing protein [Alphaproteobacteria bacterium]
MTQKYLSENDTSEYTGLSAKTLQRYRAHGTGPRFIKTLGRVLYDKADLDAWLEGLKRLSTSEPEV